MNGSKYVVEVYDAASERWNEALTFEDRSKSEQFFECVDRNGEGRFRVVCRTEIVIRETQSKSYCGICYAVWKVDAPRDAACPNCGSLDKKSSPPPPAPLPRST